MPAASAPQPPAAAPGRPRSAAAIRQARRRRRARLGLVAVVVEVPADRLAEHLIDRGLIGETEALDERKIAAALSLLVRRMVGG